MVLTLSGFLIFLIGSTKPCIWSCSLSTRQTLASRVFSFSDARYRFKIFISLPE